VPPEKPKIVEAAEKEVAVIDDYYKKGPPALGTERPLQISPVLGH